MDDRRSQNRAQPTQAEAPASTAAIAVKIHYGKAGDGYGAMVYRSIKEIGGRERGDTIAHFFETSTETFAEACQRAETFAAALSGDAKAYVTPRNTRERFIDAIGAMPMQAMGYIVVACTDAAMRLQSRPGLDPEARDSLNAMLKAAEDLTRGVQ